MKQSRSLGRRNLNFKLQRLDAVCCILLLLSGSLVLEHDTLHSTTVAQLHSPHLCCWCFQQSWETPWSWHWNWHVATDHIEHTHTHTECLSDPEWNIKNCYIYVNEWLRHEFDTSFDVLNCTRQVILNHGHAFATASFKARIPSDFAWWCAIHWYFHCVYFHLC